MESKEPKYWKQGVEWWLPWAEQGVNGEMSVQGYRLPVIRCISSGDLMGCEVTVVNNTVHLKAAKRADLKCSHHKKEMAVL